MDILNLPDCDVIERSQTALEYVFMIRYTVLPAACPMCGQMLPRLQKFGTMLQEFRDLPIHGKSVNLIVQRQRFRCQECKQTFMNFLPDFDEKRRATKRFVQYVGFKALSRTFTSLADELGVNEKTIRNIFNDYVADLEKQFTFTTPRWLGIDEITIAGQPRCVLANVEKRRIFDMLSNRKRETIVKRLKQLDAGVVELVAMDMWTSYREAANQVLPKAIVVIDKFHVVRMANDALEKVRRNIRADLTDRQRRTLMHDRFLLLKREKDLKPEKKIILESWLGSFPDLKSVYELKEDFFGIWDQAKNSADAKAQYAEWRDRIPSAVTWAFHDLTTALKNWEPEIFAYFDHRITNAYTESFNNLIRVSNRLGRGYSFKALRAKMLYLPTTTRSYHRARESEAYTADQEPTRLRTSEITRSAGVAISTIIREIKQMEFDSISTDEPDNSDD